MENTMPKVTPIFTEDQALLLDNILEIEATKNIKEQMYEIMINGGISGNTTDEERKIRETVLKPFIDKDKVIYDIQQALSAGWPKS